MPALTIPLPKEFSYAFALDFLKRSPHENLHQVNDGQVTKWLALGNERVLISISEENQQLLIHCESTISPSSSQRVIRYVEDWFDLATDLKPFYRLAKNEPLLAPLVKKYYGYRIIGQPDLFESLVWAVLGQQINLGFAFTLKERFVEKWGERYQTGNQTYFLFPTIETVASLLPEQLLALQFSRQKAAYTIGIAKAFQSGEVSREHLSGLSFDEAKAHLMAIKGIGNWTANYALMKTFRYPNAFPLEDAGLHNAIKNQLRLRKKPSLDRVRKIFRKYKGWEAYATLYLWKSL